MNCFLLLLMHDNMFICTIYFSTSLDYFSIKLIYTFTYWRIISRYQYLSKLYLNCNYVIMCNFDSKLTDHLLL